MKMKLRITMNLKIIYDFNLKCMIILNKNKNMLFNVHLRTLNKTIHMQL